MNLAELIKEEGRSQKWVRAQLAERGIRRNKSYFNEYCNDHHTPRDEYIYSALAEILNRTLNEIKACFSKNREAGNV